MESLQECMLEYRKQLERGRIQKAYKGLMEYMLALRTHFKKKYPEYVVSGSIYFGYMDMTYIAFFPKSLKRRNLKVAIVYLHDAGRFEAWLGGYNKQVQAKYWRMFKDSGWKKYRLVSDLQGVDSILEHVLVSEPDFDDPDSMTKQIESGTMKFIQEIERFLDEAA